MSFSQAEAATWAAALSHACCLEGIASRRWSGRIRRASSPRVVRPSWECVGRRFLSGAHQAGDNIGATGGRIPSQPRQSGGILQHRSGSRKGGDRGGCFRRHAASYLGECRPPRSHDEGLHRSSRGMRNADPGKRPGCNHSSALVRTRSRTPLALRSGPSVLVT